MVDATIGLLFVSTRVIREKTEQCLRLYKAIVALVFCATLHLSTSLDSESQQKIVTDNIAKVQQCFTEWISSIGRDMFGGERSVSQKNVVEELKVFSTIL